MAEKTEKPTPKKLRDARRQGQIPRSRVLSAGCVLLAGSLGFLASFDSASARLRSWTERLFLEQVAGPDLAPEALWVLAWFVGPSLFAAVLAGFFVGVFGAGFAFHPEQLAPKLERIDPIAGFKKLFSVQRLAEPTRAFVLLVVLSLILWGDAQDAAPAVLGAVAREGTASLVTPLRLVTSAFLKLVGVVLVLGIADYGWERWQHLRRLRMSREEVRREYKDAEGDPQHKAQRKSVHRQLASGGAARGVQKATAVVVNPTHIAIALRYAPEECDAPYLVAKGREEDAHAIRREAKQCGIPIVRDIPLARSLIHFDVGEEIPEELYRAAAAVLKVAMESRDVDTQPRRKSS